MNFGVITLFPEAFSAIQEHGITSRAFQNQLATLTCWNPRDFTDDKHNTVDDRPYGGGPGMVMMAPPLIKATEAAKATAGLKAAKVIYLSPQGKELTQKVVKQLAEEPSLILIAGRYEGIDERVIETVVDEEISIGDYVLSGGELPAMVLMDAIIRRLPGALGHQDSAQQDSHENALLDCPHYTRPVEYAGRRVPAVLLSGNHTEIQRWRLQAAVERTAIRRPDLIENCDLTETDKSEIADILAQYKEDKGL